MSLDSYYENRRRTPAEDEAWEAFEAAFDLAEEHLSRPIRKVEMSKSTHTKLFGGPCSEIWGADVIVNDALLDKNVIFDG